MSRSKCFGYCFSKEIKSIACGVCPQKSLGQIQISSKVSVSYLLSQACTKYFSLFQVRFPKTQQRRSTLCSRNKLCSNTSENHSQNVTEDESSCFSNPPRWPHLKHLILRLFKYDARRFPSSNMFYIRNPIGKALGIFLKRLEDNWVCHKLKELHLTRKWYNVGQKQHILTRLQDVLQADQPDQGCFPQHRCVLQLLESELSFKKHGSL